MDIALLQASAYELPTSRRVGVVVHDGATDLRIWRGPGPDKDLAFSYGPEALQQLLESEKQRSEGSLPLGRLLRLHPGKLHCDFLLWLSSRDPEQGGVQAPAPSRELLEEGVKAVLEFVAPRNVIRVAFPALGAGPDAIDDAQRLAIIVKACSEYYEERLAKGLPNTIEEVLVCDPRLSVVSQARRLVSHIAKAPPTEKPQPGAPTPKPARAAKAASPRASKSAASAPKKTRLDDREIALAKATSNPWDRNAIYAVGNLFIHSKFGVGRVEEVTRDNFIVVLFQDGEVRRLMHAG